mmetsp:Transcript_12735/g.32727  ORF Transcript_12735/g.32727 Transcript_12735/m.32727 type:complete len:206 (-) Transcript_12735:36-653(-)
MSSSDNWSRFLLSACASASAWSASNSRRMCTSRNLALQQSAGGASSVPATSRLLVHEAALAPRPQFHEDEDDTAWPPLLDVSVAFFHPDDTEWPPLLHDSVAAFPLLVHADAVAWLPWLHEPSSGWPFFGHEVCAASPQLPVPPQEASLLLLPQESAPRFQEPWPRPRPRPVEDCQPELVFLQSRLFQVLPPLAPAILHPAGFAN